VAEFKYLGTVVTHQTELMEWSEVRIKFREFLLPFSPKSLSSHVLYQNVKFAIYKAIILRVVLYGYKTWFPSRGECRLRVLKNRVLRVFEIRGRK
jgi:hypothetical protein